LECGKKFKDSARALAGMRTGVEKCILILLGAIANGRREIPAITDGYCESEQSWKALLLDVKARGLVIDPKWLRTMAPSDSGRLCRRSIPRHANCAA
jgi:hypothetical protein